MPTTDTPKQNRLLAALSPGEYAHLVDDLEFVSLKCGQVLFESGSMEDYVYFPTTCLVSRISTTRSGTSSELAVTGNDGLVGIGLILGGKTTAHRAEVQIAGNAYRLKADVMLWELDQGGETQHLCLRYTMQLMKQMAQNIICSRHHTLDQQLCRWLLLCQERMQGNQLAITQERIANMLGVRREGVTEAAGKLQAAGLIHYSRGHITLTDRPGLEARVCECYSALNSEHESLDHEAPVIRLKNRARPNPATLRRRAEARLSQAEPEVPDTAWETTRLLHELQVHQIELEMQNEELLCSYGEADALRARYADIYDFAPVGFFTLDSQGSIFDLNLAGAILLGIKRSQKNRHRFADFVVPEHVGTFHRFIKEVIGEKSKKYGEFNLLPGEHRPVATVRIEAVPDETGHECRMVVIDITAEKRSETALQTRDQYRRDLLNNIPFNVWLKDDKGCFLAVNKPLADEFDLPSGETIVGKTDFDLYPKEIAESYQIDEKNILAGGTSRHDELLIPKNGKNRWFEVYRSPVVINNKPVGTVGFAWDITDRRTLREALERSENQHRDFMDNMPIGAFIAQDGLFKYINPKAAALFGYPVDAFVGRSFLPLIVESDRAKVISDHDLRMSGSTGPLEYEVQGISQSGKIIDCRFRFTAVMWEGRTASLAIFEDVTEKNHIKAELQSLESIDLLTHLANRKHFTARLDEELSRIHRNANHKAALLAIKLGCVTLPQPFEQAAGDAILRHLSAVLSVELRKSDISGRIGQDEFAVVLPGADLATASVFAERLQQKIAKKSVIIGTVKIAITVRIAVSVLGAEDANADQVLAREIRKTSSQSTADLPV